MDQRLKNRNGETEAHTRLKRLAFLWAQTQGYSACAMEVTLPRCRYRADVAAYRPNRKQSAATTAIFECKQALVDLRRDNGCTATTTRRLEKIHERREILERNLRVHYPALRIADSLFAEFDSHNFEAIDHRGYKQVVRQTRALQNRLFDGTKFETLTRYRCANLFFLVLPDDLFREPEIPIGWGALIESAGELTLVRKPVWHEATEQSQLQFLQRIASAVTRALNRTLEITLDDVAATRCRSC
ncbi:MAG TPA: hypothetical protein VJ281_02585 [Chthoniobacterales bacterium]|jgi:hypothetical protein|nr:hypothetical protein [Chthoniobacterales bacterium]